MSVPYLLFRGKVFVMYKLHRYFWCDPRNILELHNSNTQKLRTRRGLSVIIRVRDVLKYIRKNTDQSNVDKILIVKVHETEVKRDILSEILSNTGKLKLVPVFECELSVCSIRTKDISYKQGCFRVIPLWESDGMVQENVIRYSRFRYSRTKTWTDC